MTSQAISTLIIWSMGIGPALITALACLFSGAHGRSRGLLRKGN